MKFEKYLKRNIDSEYKHYYLDYTGLNRLLREDFNQKDEQVFVRMVDENIKRVFDFIEVKKNELEHRLTRLDSKGKDGSTNRKTSNNSNTMSTKNTKKFIKRINKEMKKFSEFVRINIVGIKKILKKHDKKTIYNLYIKYKPILKDKIKKLDALNKLIYQSSKLVICQVSNTCNSFIRKTDKYWVHNNNINALKFYILQYLPLYVYNMNYEYETQDNNINSVYLDNKEYGMYYDRLKKIQHSEAIRIRWYGKDITKTVYIERKRHEDGWTGDISKKLRFMISECKVEDYMNGVDVYDDVCNLNEDTEELRVLYNEIQQTILKKNLKPMVQTSYKRMAFQHAGNSTIRVSLDTDLCMIKVDKWGDDRIDGRNIANGSNTNSNINTKNIYNTETSSLKRVTHFPYAILEIKTQCPEEYKPQWVTELINGSMVEHVHKFSKYLHGISVLYHVTEIPYWIPQMTTKILKDPYEVETEYKEFDNSVLINVNQTEKDSDELSPVDILNKRISIPVRVEPKVFFANERTFLSWVQFSIFLGGIGTAMFGLQGEKSTFCGFVLIGVSVIFSFYALYLYLWRASMIRRRDPGPYDDKYGPPVLVCVFLFAMCMAVLYKFPLKKVF